MSNLEQLHLGDNPLTIRVLGALFAGREVAGYVPLSSGAKVDWVGLAEGSLSTTEKATVLIACGFRGFSYTRSD